MPLLTQLFTEISTKPKKTTPLWINLRKQFPSSGKCYEPAHLFSEGGRSLHDSATKATALLSRILNEDPNKVKKQNPPQTQCLGETVSTSCQREIPSGKSRLSLLNQSLDGSLHHQTIPTVPTFQTTTGRL